MAMFSFPAPGGAGKQNEFWLQKTNPHHGKVLFMSTLQTSTCFWNVFSSLDSISMKEFSPQAKRG
jgi:hypothetical protein